MKGVCKNKDRIGDPKPPELPEEMAQQMCKVGAFYRGTTEVVSVLENLKIEEKSTSENLPSVPIIDKVSQLTFRRRILMDSLERGLSVVNQSVSLPCLNQVRSTMKDFVNTFNLTSSNIGKVNY